MKSRIKELRQELHLTQEQFANRIGIKRGAVANYEIGRNEPVDSVISLICREFNVNENWLRTGEGEMFKPTPTTTLDKLCEEYNCDDIDRSLIEAYLNLSPDQRATLRQFTENIALTQKKETADS